MENKKKLIEKGWAIKGQFGIYMGWWLTRKDAITEHTKDVGQTWKYCRERRGDQAVKIIIKEA